MTKKNKILTIIFSVTFFVVLIIVLSSTVFTVGSIKLDLSGTINKLASLTESEVAQESKISYNTNVFFVSKSVATKNIEKAFPYIKVLGIETVFPNTLVVHAKERYQVFAIQQTNNYILVDSDFKVLEINDGDFVSTDANAIKIVGAENIETNVGEFLNATDAMKAFMTLENSFYQNDDPIEYMLNLFQSASFSDTKIVFQTFLGVKIEMFKPTFKQQQKVAMIYEVLQTMDTAQKSTGTIIIGDRNGKVEGSYTQNA